LGRIARAEAGVGVGLDGKIVFHVPHFVENKNGQRVVCCPFLFSFLPEKSVFTLFAVG